MLARLFPTLVLPSTLDRALLTSLQSIDTCTKILGPLRQNVFACLTCNPPPASPAQLWTPAGVCYACSIQCHGEHTLVEIFQKRNFTCDCGTTRIPSTSPCSLRTNNETNTKGGVHSEEPDANNKYNQNFQNKFCGCGGDYDPFEQKGTMFQCLGLGTAETGGCGEDWFHPGCLVGMGPKWFEKMAKTEKPKPQSNGDAGLATIAEGNEGGQENGTNDEAVVDDEDEPPMPPGFPEEDDFEGFICHKCVESNPWIKSYAGSSGFLPPVRLDHNATVEQAVQPDKKRKAEDDADGEGEAKRLKSEEQPQQEKTAEENGRINGDVKSLAVPSKDKPSDCKLRNLPTPPSTPFSIFFKEDFRDKFCRCSSCYRNLNAHPQLLEEEETYEPPISEGGGSEHGGSTAGSGSLLERGESALKNIDRVRAIEGVMAYNHLKEKLRPLFQKFAESGEALGAEHIKAHFAQMRGDEEGMKEGAEAVRNDENGDHRREQGGY